MPLILAIAAFFLGALAWLGGSRRVTRHVFEERSAANTSGKGLSLAYRYLAREAPHPPSAPSPRAGGEGRGEGPRRKVSMLTKPLGLAGLEPDAVVFRTGLLVLIGREEHLEQEKDDKKQDPKKKNDKKPEVREQAPPMLSDAEADWVHGGGRLVIAVTEPFASLEQRNPPNKSASKVFPLWPGIDTLTMSAKRAWEASSLGAHMHAVYTAGGYVVMARQSIGAGDVILLSVPEMLTNEHLRSGNHLALLIALAGNQRPVYFDEFVHGMASEGGSLDIMREWNLGPLLLMLAAGALLVFWRNARRIGPPEEEYRDTRSDAVDLVASLGALYERRMSEAEAIALYHEALTRSVAAHSGLRGEALHKRVADLTGGLSVPKWNDKLPRPVFQRMLMTINDAFRKTAERAGGVHADHR
ncbi:MAG TPA: hypothetical protein VGR02_04185 [Thermoanaerobaculia bacterium]|nr:hypothetical protein [Thermoanaerobaculia bacterium]